MHGLIFETSIWLLAGSTRFLRSSLLCLHTKDWKSHTNLHSVCYCVMRIYIQHERTEFYFYHTFQVITTTTCETQVVSRNYPTKHHMDFHAMQLDAKLGIHQKYEYKFSNTLQLRRAAGLKSCIFQLAPVASQEKPTTMLNWKTFSMRRLTHPNSTTFAASFFCRFTKNASHPVSQPPLRAGTTSHLSCLKLKDLMAI